MQDIVDSLHIIDLSDEYYSAKYKTSNSEEIVSAGELRRINSFDPGKATEDDGVVSNCATEIRRQVKEVEGDLLKIQPGWVHFGGKPPRGACYVGRYKGTYAWVDPNGRRQLADFTLTALKFSDLIKPNTITTSPGGVRFSPSVGR
jgi:hypothetical protein